MLLDIKGFKENPTFQKKFERYNKKYFNGELPDVIVGTAPLLKINKIAQKTLENLSKPEKKYIDGGQYALACVDENGVSYIVLDEKMCVYYKIMAEISLIHECIHHKISLQFGHGPRFKAEIRRLAALGALDNLI